MISSQSLKFIFLLLTLFTHSDWVVPTPQWHRSSVGRAVVAHTLSTCPAVMNGEFNGERALADITFLYLFIRHPVGGSSCVFYHAWNIQHTWIIWPASREKGPWDICKKCRPRPAAASPTQRLHKSMANIFLAVYTIWLLICVFNTG